MGLRIACFGWLVGFCLWLWWGWLDCLFGDLVTWFVLVIVFSVAL